MSIRIMGTGSALPGRVVENRELEGMVDTSDEWIRERTGIGSRHVSTGETVASLAAEACGRALADAGRQAEEVELILAATCSPEEAAPCVACRIQSEIGAGNAVAFDVNAACAGFLFALHTAWAYVEAGIYRNALIAGSEVLSKLVDWEDRGTCILFGDGAGAVYVEKCETGGILGFVQHADGKKGGVLGGGGRQLSNPWAGQQDYRRFFQMDGREVFAFAVRQVPLNVEEALGKAGLDHRGCGSVRAPSGQPAHHRGRGEAPGRKPFPLSHEPGVGGQHLLRGHPASAGRAEPGRTPAAGDAAGAVRLRGRADLRGLRDGMVGMRFRGKSLLTFFPK